MTPEALSTWIQRAGRAGRDGRLSRAILLVEPSVIKQIGGPSSKPSKHLRDAAEGTVYYDVSFIFTIYMEGAC